MRGMVHAMILARCHRLRYRRDSGFEPFREKVVPVRCESAISNGLAGTRQEVVIEAEIVNSDQPLGKATVVVTFEPDGTVSAATVSDPPFAGTATGNCIAQAMKRASVPPFSGLPGTVSKSLAIQ